MSQDREQRVCDVAGCHRPFKMGWIPMGRWNKALRVCYTHGHGDIKVLLRTAGISFEEYKRHIRALRDRKKFSHILSSVPGVRRRGKDARRLLWEQFHRSDCSHPPKWVIWDKLYKSKRCMKCGYRVEKRGGEWCTNKDKGRLHLNQHFKPGSLQRAMSMFLCEYGIMTTTWEDAIQVARAVLPGTKFNENSFSFYRNNFVKKYLMRKTAPNAGNVPVVHNCKPKEKGTTMGLHKKHRDEDEDGKPRKKHKDKDKKEKKRTILSTVMSYFDEVGVKKATYEGTKKRVLKYFPDSAFKEPHLGWYRAKYREIHSDD